MERFGLADNEMFLRDYKHMKSYSSIDDIVNLLNRVDESDNCAVDLIKKELAKQEDEDVKAVLMNILDSLERLSNSYHWKTFIPKYAGEIENFGIEKLEILSDLGLEDIQVIILPADKINQYYKKISIEKIDL